MPYARITLARGQSQEYVRAVADGVHRALVETFEVPPGDRFQIVHQVAPEELVFDRSYLGGPRSDAFVHVALTTGRTRPPATKAAFYRRVVELLEERPGVRREDVMIVISDSRPEDWSVGGGRQGIGPLPAARAPAEDAAVRRRPLLGVEVAAARLARVEAQEITLAPGARVPRHRHPCEVVGVVRCGRIRYQREGAPPVELAAGDGFHEPAGAVVTAFDNADAAAPATFVAFYLLPGAGPTIELLG